MLAEAAVKSLSRHLRKRRRSFYKEYNMTNEEWWEEQHQDQMLRETEASRRPLPIPLLILCFLIGLIPLWIAWMLFK